MDAVKDPLQAQRIWTQRIHTENKINAAPSGEYRVVTCDPKKLITDAYTAGAPMANKNVPGQPKNSPDPSKSFTKETFTGKLLANRICKLGPRRTALVPQSTYQVHGWVESGDIEGTFSPRQMALEEKFKNKKTSKAPSVAGSVKSSKASTVGDGAGKTREISDKRRCELLGTKPFTPVLTDPDERSKPEPITDSHWENMVKPTPVITGMSNWNPNFKPPYKAPRAKDHTKGYVTMLDCYAYAEDGSGKTPVPPEMPKPKPKGKRKDESKLPGFNGHYDMFQKFTGDGFPTSVTRDVNPLKHNQYIGEESSYAGSMVSSAQSWMRPPKGRKTNVGENQHVSEWRDAKSADEQLERMLIQDRKVNEAYKYLKECKKISKSRCNHALSQGPETQFVNSYVSCMGTTPGAKTQLMFDR